MPNELDEYPVLNELLNKGPVPILFIGAGIPKRYLGMEDWKELLKNASNMIGFTQEMYVGCVQDAKQNSTGDSYLPALASNLAKGMAERLTNGELNKKNLEIFSDKDWESCSDNTDPFKLLISRLIERHNLVSDPNLNCELELFKKLGEKIPVVITTNYDTFLEEYIFKDFDVFLCSDDVYFSKSDGVGEILKIHGSISNPDSLVITSEDYKSYTNRVNLILARITSLLCEYPLMFLGHSLNDEDVRSIIADLVKSLEGNNIRILQDNIIHVDYDEYAEKPTVSSYVFDAQNAQIRITQIRTKEYLPILQYLNKFEPRMTALELKKFKSIVSKITLTHDSTTKHRLIGLDNIQNIDSDKLVVAVGPWEYMSILEKTVGGISPENSYKYVLCDEKDSVLHISKTAFLNWMQLGFIKNNKSYVPVFYFMKKHELSMENLPDNVKQTVGRIKEQLDRELNKYSEKYLWDESQTIEEYISKINVDGNKCKVIAYNYHIGKLSRDKCIELLKELYKKGKQQALKLDKKYTMNTELRIAITCLDYKEWLACNTSSTMSKVITPPT